MFVGVGIEWAEIEAAYLQRGFIGDQIVAQITGGAREYTAWIHGDYCGNPTGIAITGFETREAARATVERIVAEARNSPRPEPGAAQPDPRRGAGGKL